MPIIKSKDEVLRLYEEAADRKWVVPTFCAENQTTVEAILAACQAKADELSRRVPITIAITGQYDHRAQSLWYSTSRDAITGLTLFLDDVEVLARADGPYPDVDVLTHFDHGQPDLDADILAATIDRFSSVMFDASALPWEENLARTAAFVAAHGSQVLVEGAADEVIDAGGAEHAELTTPERAEEFLAHTGVDMVVANLGTEHRASAADLRYVPEAARAISERIGPKLVLHGASSVPAEQLATLFADGVCKVNVWTILERQSSAVLLAAMVSDATAVAGRAAVEELVAAGLLGVAALSDGNAQLSRCTTAWRNDVVHEEMRNIIANYLNIWYRA